MRNTLGNKHEDEVHMGGAEEEHRGRYTEETLETKKSKTKKPDPYI